MQVEDYPLRRVYTFRDGLRLYHITPIRRDDPDMIVERPWLEDIPIGTYTFNLDLPMYFGLAEEHTMFYDSKIEGEWYSAHLATKSTAVLKLIDYGAHRPSDREAINFVTPLGIDGWIAYPDPYDNWREVCLLRPRDVIGELMELDHYNYDRPGITEYAWKDKDQANLNKSCIGSFRVKDLIVK